MPNAIQVGKKKNQLKFFFNKMAEVLKGTKINETKNCFEQWKKNILIAVLHQMESTLKVTSKFEDIIVNTQFLK